MAVRQVVRVVAALAAPGTWRALAAALLVSGCGSGGEGGSGNGLQGGIADPAGAGSYAVRRFDGVTVKAAQGRQVLATICAPSSDGGLSVAGGAFPLVVFAPGNGISRAQYDGTCRHLATWGIIAVLHDYSGSTFANDGTALVEDVGGVITWALGPDSSVAAAADPARVAVAGHSYGGWIAARAALGDARVKAYVGWDPVDGTPSIAPQLLGSLAVPLAVIGEVTDSVGGFQPCAPLADNYAKFYDAVPSPALEVTVIGAAQMDFVDDRASCGIACSFCQAGTADHAAVKALARRTTIAFLRRTLLGDGAMDNWLNGAGIRADVAAGKVNIRSK